jgi:hypothetical protein
VSFYRYVYKQQKCDRLQINALRARERDRERERERCCTVWLLCTVLDQGTPPSAHEFGANKIRQVFIYFERVPEW